MKRDLSPIRNLSHLKLYLKIIFKCKFHFKVVIFHCMKDHKYIMTYSVQTDSCLGADVESEVQTRETRTGNRKRKS